MVYYTMQLQEPGLSVYRLSYGLEDWGSNPDWVMMGFFSSQPRPE